VDEVRAAGIEEWWSVDGESSRRPDLVHVGENKEKVRDREFSMLGLGCGVYEEAARSHHLVVATSSAPGPPLLSASEDEDVNMEEDKT
jgi:hypothetical protein